MRDEVGEPHYSDMQSEKACDYNDHDNYTDDVENIHWFAPIEHELDQVCIGKRSRGAERIRVKQRWSTPLMCFSSRPSNS